MNSSASSTSWLTSKRALLALIVILLLARAIAVRDQPSLGGGSNPAPQAQSDATIKATMIDNLSNMRDTAIRFDGNTPDIAVTDGALIVATTIDPSDTATAASLCQSVAAFTNDPNTSRPLGISSVTIISGGHSIANCRP